MRNRVLRLEGLEHLLASRGDDTGNGERLAATKAALRQAMERELTERQRECVRLYYFEGLTEEECAKALGVGKSTVCRHLQKARQRLEHVLRYVLE